jgi:sulfur carrier protein ThiS
MIVIKGRGILEKYSGHLEASEGLTVNRLISILGVPSEIAVVALAIQNGRVVQGQSIVNDGDAIDLIIIPEGG